MKKIVGISGHSTLTPEPMADRIRKFGWRTGGDVIRDVIIGITIATAILYIENSANDQVPNARGIARTSSWVQSRWPDAVTPRPR